MTFRTCPRCKQRSLSTGLMQNTPYNICIGNNCSYSAPARFKPFDPVVTSDGRTGQIVGESDESYRVLLNGGFQEDFAKDSLTLNTPLIIAWEATELLTALLKKHCTDKAGKNENDALLFAVREAVMNFNYREESDRNG